MSAICSCSSDNDRNVAPTGGDGVKPLYALASRTITTDSGTTYINLFDSPDITSVDFKQAREFHGVVGAEALDGKLFVSSGDAPIVTRFGVTDDKVWKEDGSINFATYASKITLSSNAFGQSKKGYMALNVVDRLVWEPDTLTIRSQQIAGTDIVRDRDGLSVRASFDRAIATRDNAVYWPYYWSDNTYYRIAPVSQIAVYDTDKDQLRTVIDVPCPGVDFVSKDDAGNLYFSNWAFATLAPAFEAGAPKTCVVRVKAGETAIDPSFTFRFEEVTEGRQGIAFHYLGNQTALFAAFHRELVPASTDPKKALQGNYWRFWSFDMKTQKAKIVDGIDYFSGGYRAERVDGRTFLLIPRADHASTVAYEMFPDGSVKRLYESPGWAYHFFRVR
ncbi:MxcI [Pendulispora albinea]|uniref:MxcI n=1 Tax=Pendulispora albinea TaxID=2741071 RepID=A0ABZ2LX35_9BACT